MTARCTLCMGALKIFRSPWLRPWLLFPKCLMGFVSTEHINVHAKYEVRSFTHSSDNRGYPKKWAVSGYAHAPFSPNFLMDFCSDAPYVLAKFEIRSFSRSWDNKGYPKKMDSPCMDTPTLPFLQNFSWAFVWSTLLLFWPNLKFQSINQSINNKFI